MTENVAREFGHEECKMCIDTFVSRHSYQDCCSRLFAKEHTDAFVHMYDDPLLVTCGKRNLCWECISYFDKKLNEVAFVEK